MRELEIEEYAADDMEAEGYPWFFFNGSRSRWISLLVTVIVIMAAVLFFFWYKAVGNDPTPDSIVGYTFAFIGTAFMLIATVRYALYRRSRKRYLGKLNASLNWHISLGVLAFVFLLIHSFGNFNPRTGTWALWGMIALVISGMIGRFLDHILPRLTAVQVSKALTEQGEDRLELVSRELQSSIQYYRQELGAASNRRQRAAFQKENAALAARASARRGVDQPLPTSWDLAFISLEETPQEVSRDNEVQYRFVPDRKSALANPEALMPGTRDRMSDLKTIEKALHREQVFRYITRYWRIFHIGLALLTVALTLWHLEFALSLLIPVWLGR